MLLDAHRTHAGSAECLGSLLLWPSRSRSPQVLVRFEVSLTRGTSRHFTAGAAAPEQAEHETCSVRSHSCCGGKTECCSRDLMDTCGDVTPTDSSSSSLTPAVDGSPPVPAVPVDFVLLRVERGGEVTRPAAYLPTPSSAASANSWTQQ